jgi:ribosome-binding ATPase YchF (GTP1/OBG family)
MQKLEHAQLVGKLAEFEQELKKMKEEKKMLVKKMRMREEVARKKMYQVVAVLGLIVFVSSVVAMFLVAISMK